MPSFYEEQRAKGEWRRAQGVEHRVQDKRLRRRAKVRVKGILPVSYNLTIL